MKYLPPEIWRLIYEYDNTYYIKYKEVMKHLKNTFFKYNWYVHHTMYSNDLYQWRFKMERLRRSGF